MVLNDQLMNKMIKVHGDEDHDDEGYDDERRYITCSAVENIKYNFAVEARTPSLQRDLLTGLACRSTIPPPPIYHLKDFTPKLKITIKKRSV